MLISEIFSSIDGESKRAGELATFVRTVGCNLRCSYCDSKYTWEKEATSKEMTIDEIVDKCKELGNHNITFTGGEPLLQKEADNLIKALQLNGFEVSVETNGAVDFTKFKFFHTYDHYDKNLAWVCVDYKCGSSGMEKKMIGLDKFAKLRSFDVLKFVVGSYSDLLEALMVMEHLRKQNCDCWFYLSPVFGAIEPKEIVEFMQKHNLQYKTRFQLQLHKMIWNPDMRGV